MEAIRNKSLCQGFQNPKILKLLYLIVGDSFYKYSIIKFNENLLWLRLQYIIKGEYRKCKYETI